MQPFIATHIEALQQTLLGIVQKGQRVALVPTMGALHQGHLALIDHAKTLADIVVVSIFVNPTQFGPNEDFNKYPRNLEQDAKLAQSSGATLIYAPAVEDLYPDDFSTNVSAGPITQILCGQFRPGHFDGVATIVSKLLLRVLPHVAVFGEKDYQQLCVIRRVTDDLDIPVDIVGFPTVREADGLALSSRNRYLNDEQRNIAPKLHETLQFVKNDILSGKHSVQDSINAAVSTLSNYGYRLDYLALCDGQTLAPLNRAQEDARLLVAAWLGDTRLIDNIPLE